jgi:hypothetical protein
VDADSVATVQDVAAQGTETGAPDGPPKEKVTFDSVTVN